MVEPRAPGRRATALVLAAAATLLLVRLGATDLWAPDEPRYAQIADEVLNGDAEWGTVLLRLAGEPYTQKPPLYFWLAALAGAASDRVSELAARLPSALAGVGAVLATLALGNRLLPHLPHAGVFSALLLLGVFRFAHLARRAQLDVLLTLFETLAFLALWQLDRWSLAREPDEEAAEPPWRLLALLHGSTGLALLTKGPVGLLPLGAMAVYLAWDRRLETLRVLLRPRWLVISLGPFLVWGLLVIAVAPPGFFGEAVVENVLGRFFAGTSHARPVYYFLYQLPADFMPWTLIWPLAAIHAARALRAGGPDARPQRFLIAWFGSMLVFFSLSAGKRGLYLLPAFPALSLLCGAAICRALSGGAALPRAVALGSVATAVFVGVGGGTVALLGGLEVAAGFRIPAAFGAASATVAVCALLLCALPVARHTRASIQMLIALGAVIALELAIFALAYPAFDSEKSPRGLAEAAARVRPGAPIGVFGQRALIGGIAYYSRSPVVELASVDDARAFRAAGGGAIVVKERNLEHLSAAIPVEPRATARSGRRTQVVVATAPRARRDALPDTP